MRAYLAVVAVPVLLFAGCGGGKPNRPQASVGLALPDLQVAASLPQFAKEVNEVQIADSFNDVDPSWVIGALVNIKTGKIYALDSYLKADAKPVITPQTEMVFKNFIENSVAANAQWLEFVKTEVSDTTRAEVSVAKTAKVTINSQSVDKAELLRQLQASQISSRDDYGVVIGYTNYVLSAAYFRNSGAGGSVSGYGAKIGGNWYSKSENSSAQHRIVAVWSPLPFVIEAVSKNVSVDLSGVTSEAVKDRKLDLRKLEATSLKIERLKL